MELVDGQLVSDDDGRIMMANRHIETLFGHDRDSVIGMRIEMLLPVRWRAAHHQHRARYRRQCRGSGPWGWGLELLGAHADGSEFPVEISLSPVATDRGTVTVVIIRDVTQQRAHERAACVALVNDENERIASRTSMTESTSTPVPGRGSPSRESRPTTYSTMISLHDCARVIDELDTAIKDILLHRVRSPRRHHQPPAARRLAHRGGAVENHAPGATRIAHELDRLYAGLVEGLEHAAARPAGASARLTARLGWGCVAVRSGSCGPREQLLGDLPTLRVVESSAFSAASISDRLIRRNPECWGALAELSDLGGKGFRSHAWRRYASFHAVIRVAVN